MSKFRLTRDDSDKKKPTRYFSDKQEKAVAKAIGGKQTANSGATVHQKGDVSTDKILVECKTKTTESKSISIQKEWLEKLRSESIYMKKPYYALFFNFGPDESNYVIIPENLYTQIVEKLNNGEFD